MPTDPARTPRRSDAARNRERLLTAAAEVFAERGTGASLKEVADHAGLGVGTVYRHLKDKEGLIVSLLTPQLQELSGLAQQALADEPATPAFIRFTEQAAAMLTDSVALAELLMNPSPVPAPLRQQVSNLIALAEQLLGQAQDEGGIRPELTASDLITQLVAVHAIEQTFGSYRRGVYRRSLAVFLDGACRTDAARRALPVPPLQATTLLSDLA